MQRTRFRRELFGYRRTAVAHRITDYTQEIDRLKAELDESAKALHQARAEKEELSLTVAAMRRQHIQQATRLGAVYGRTVTLMMGPTDSLASVTRLIDALEGCPHLIARFRVFRDGFYRIDGTAVDMHKLVSWLNGLSDVRDTVVEGDSLHIVPRGVGA